MLDPAPTDYDDRVFYSTYEIGDMLAVPGEHSLDVLVGRGPYDIHIPAAWNLDESPWRATPCFIAQLEITYRDGSTDCAVAIVPWTLYRYRGDRRILEETYPALRRYIEWGEKRLDERGLANYGLEDWCPPLPRDEWWRWTPPVCTSTAWWFEAVRIAAKEARLLGHDEDAARFETLAEKTREAARKAFGKEDGTWSSGTQCAQAAAIATGLVAPERREAAARKLVESVEATSRLIKCGILGVKRLFRALRHLAFPGSAGDMSRGDIPSGMSA